MVASLAMKSGAGEASLHHTVGPKCWRRLGFGMTWPRIGGPKEPCDEGPQLVELISSHGRDEGGW
jgi:hypothetical protein